MNCDLGQVHGAAATLEASIVAEGRPDELLSALSSERSGTHGLGWALADRLAAGGRQLLGFTQAARRTLAGATAPAAPPAASPAPAPAAVLLADVDSRPCPAIQDAASSGASLNYTSVEAFCLNQVLATSGAQFSRLFAGACRRGGLHPSWQAPA